MATKKLSYFMREELKSEEIVTVPGPKTIVDENGEVVMFQVKRLKPERVDKIYDNYKTSRIAMDPKKKQPYVQNGKVVMQESSDNSRALRHVITEALVYPDLHDEELMKYYDCTDITDMPRKMFTSQEYADVIKIVQQVLGVSNETPEENDEDREEAKN